MQTIFSLFLSAENDITQGVF